MRRAFQRSLQKQGLKFKLATKVGCCLASLTCPKGLQVPPCFRCYSCGVRGDHLCSAVAAQVASAEVDDAGVHLALQPAKGDGAGESLSAEVVLVSTGADLLPEFSRASAVSPDLRRHITVTK